MKISQQLSTSSFLALVGALGRGVVVVGVVEAVAVGHVLVGGPAVDWGLEVLLLLLSLELRVAVGAEEPEGFLHSADLVSKRAVLSLRVGREQHLGVSGQWITLDVASSIIHDGEAPCRTSRAVVLVVGSVLGQHRRVNVVGRVETLIELLWVAHLLVWDVHLTIDVERLPSRIPRAPDAFLHGLPDVAVDRKAGWAPISFPLVEKRLDGPLCHPPRPLLGNIVRASLGSSLER